LIFGGVLLSEVTNATPIVC